MKEISFFVPGKPQGKARARTVRMPNGYTRTFTPDNTVIYENYIRCCFSEAENKRGERFFLESGTPVEMRLTAYFKPPASMSHKKQSMMLANRIQPLKKPDMDNIVKIVADALNGLAYFDDTQICVLTAKKFYWSQEGLFVQIREYIPEVMAEIPEAAGPGRAKDTIPGQICLEIH